eukprot:GEMP01044187.1.p1 GENE.GEMP01044187.1~~GEMP01044187.1.p1  ORF type:complete len:107 (+),score=0.82 GEMP01044187.1:774-1094(+)
MLHNAFKCTMILNHCTFDWIVTGVSLMMPSPLEFVNIYHKIAIKVIHSLVEQNSSSWESHKKIGGHGNCGSVVDRLRVQTASYLGRLSEYCHSAIQVGPRSPDTMS